MSGIAEAHITAASSQPPTPTTLKQVSSLPALFPLYIHYIQVPDRPATIWSRSMIDNRRYSPSLQKLHLQRPFVQVTIPILDSPPAAHSAAVSANRNGRLFAL